MSSQLKTAIVIDDTAIVDGQTIDAIDHTVPLDEVETQLRNGQVAVSDVDTHVKHLEDALEGVSGQFAITKQNDSANETLQFNLDATAVTSGHVPTANGSNGWGWAAVGGGGAQPVDITITAGEDLAERDYVYIDEATGTAFKVDTDVSPIRCGRLRGIVNEAGGITNTNTGTIRLLGEVSGYTGLTAWSPVYADATPGAITQTRPNPSSGAGQIAVINIGMAISTTNILIVPPTPVQYMMRDSLANNATLTLQHHLDELGHTRLAKAFIGDIDDDASLLAYSHSNQDDGRNVKDRAVDTYTVDRTGSGSPSASSNAGAGFTSDRAVDDDNATYWAANSTVTAWWQYDFGASNEKTLRRIDIRARDAGPQNSPSDFTIQYSNDGSTWTTVLTVTGETGWTASQLRLFTFDNAVAARYWRVDITDVDGGSNIAVAEFILREASTYVDGTEKVSQSFQVGTDSDITSVRLYLRRLGNPSGNLTLTIETDSSGDPSGTPVTNGTSDTVAASSLSATYGYIDFDFSTSPSLLTGTTYHLVLSSSASYANDYVRWGVDSSAPSFASGECKSYDGSTWSAESADAIFEIMRPGSYFVEPAVVGRWSGGTREIAIRYDDANSNDRNTKTTCKNVLGATADVTFVVEVM